MKALFLADLYQAKTSFKFYGVFIAVAAVITVGSSVSGEGNLGLFFPIYSILMASMMGMSLLQLDEASRWNLYAQALPCDRRDQVSCKYVVTMLCFGLVWLLFTAIYAVLALLGYMAWVQALFQSVLLLVMGLIAPAISLPPMFRWGSAKGRIIYIAMIVVLAAGLGAGAGAAALNELGVPALPGGIWIALGLLLIAALYAGSWALSVRWYEKREL